MNAWLRTQWPALAIITAMFSASAAVWPIVPERMPVHWGVSGQIDRYGSRWEGLLLMPVIAAAIYVLMALLPRIDPGRANYERFQRAYRTICLSIVAFLALIHAAILATALGVRLNVPRIILLTMGVLLLVLGNVMGKIRPNWFVGIRTPWTLSSKLSWTQTHRVGGRLFVLLGLLTFVAAFLPPPWDFALFFGPTVLATVWLLIYSYLVWRRDPERISPSGTTPADD